MSDVWKCPVQDDRSRVTKNSGGPAPAFCCLQHAALDVLNVPVLVHDAERILYLNRSARAFLRITDPHPDVTIDQLVTADAAEGSATRRQLAIENGADFGRVDVQVLRPDGGTWAVTARGARICYGTDHHHSLVQVVTAIDGNALFDDADAVVPPPARCTGDTAACIHAAAFEALPVPSAVLDGAQAVRINRAYRTLLGAEGPLDGTPLDELVHPDFAEAGMQRRHLVIDLGASVENSSAKLRARDGSCIYVVIDAIRAVFDGVPYMVTLARHATHL
jgi:PAS domain-containing protein